MYALVRNWYQERLHAPRVAPQPITWAELWAHYYGLYLMRERVANERDGFKATLEFTDAVWRLQDDVERIEALIRNWRRGDEGDPKESRRVLRELKDKLSEPHFNLPEREFGLRATEDNVILHAFGDWFSLTDLREVTAEDGLIHKWQNQAMLDNVLADILRLEPLLKRLLHGVPSERRRTEAFGAPVIN